MPVIGRYFQSGGCWEAGVSHGSVEFIKGVSRPSKDLGGEQLCENARPS